MTKTDEQASTPAAATTERAADQSAAKQQTAPQLPPPPANARLFNASYTYAKHMVDKKLLTDRFSFNALGSMKLWDRLTILGIGWFFFGGLMLALGWGIGFMANDALTDPADIHIISVQAAYWIGRMSIFLRPVFLVWWGAWMIGCAIDLVPGKNLAIQTGYAEFMTFVLMLPLCAIVVLPMFLGVTLGSLGWLGLIVSLVSGVWLLSATVIDERWALYDDLYGTHTERKLALTPWRTVVHKAGLFIVLLVSANAWWPRLGVVGVAQPGLMSWALGWLLLLFFGIVSWLLEATMKRYVGLFYVVRYGQRFREDLNIDDETWYGPRKAKRLAKKRAKQGKQG